MTVRKLQDLLAYLDFYGGAMDGLWGPETQGALLRFQQRAALRADGIPGPETEAALKKAVCLGLPEEAPEGDWWKTVRHFTRQEFACKCGQYHSPYCDGYPAEPKEALVRIADALRSHFNVEQLHFVAADGFANHMRSTLAEMDTQTYELYLKYHLATCELIELTGYSNHTLDVFRKI